MNEFSPNQAGELSDLLTIVQQREGDRVRISRGIAAASPQIRKTQGPQQLNRANNVLIGMSQCDLFDLKANALSEFGMRLLSLTPVEQYREFGKHLLTKKHGNELLDAVRSLRSRGTALTLDSIRSELKARGFEVTTNEGNASKIRLWLEKSAIVDKDWNIDETALASMLGIRQETRSDWHSLTPQQQALAICVRELTSSSGVWLSGIQVKKVCVSKWGEAYFPEGRFREKVINPLLGKGLIEARGTGEWRGGKIGEIRASRKLLEITAELKLDLQNRGIPLEVWAQLDRPASDLEAELGGVDTYKKGIALEVIAVRLAREIGLEPIAFRLRGTTTGGSEVDLIADGLHLHYSRWLIQCKATGTAVRAEVLAREVGMAHLLKAHVIVMISTGGFTQALEDYAVSIEERTSLQVVLIGPKIFQQVLREGTKTLIEALRRQAKDALDEKRLQVVPAAVDGPLVRVGEDH